MPDKSWLYNFGMLWAAGAAIGVGQALLSKEQLSWRMLIGKALCSGGLGLAAAALGFFQPDISFGVQVGAACALSTMGADIFERFATKYVGEKHGKS
jgi:hypothetical protein